jgi:hypothetical protein
VLGASITPRCQPRWYQLYLELVKVKALRSTFSGVADEKTAFLGVAGYLMKGLS